MLEVLIDLDESWVFNHGEFPIKSEPGDGMVRLGGGGDKFVGKFANSATVHGFTMCNYRQ